MSKHNSLLCGGELYMTIFSLFSANFPPHYHTILAINYVHASNRFTRSSATNMTNWWSKWQFCSYLCMGSGPLTTLSIFTIIGSDIFTSLRRRLACETIYWYDSTEIIPLEKLLRKPAKGLYIAVYSKVIFFVHTWFILARQLFLTCSLTARRWPRNWTGANGFWVMVYAWCIDEAI